jgi:hypothetical protein
MPHTGLRLANCYFSHDSSGFSVLLPFFDAPFGGSFHPFPCYPVPPAPTWWCPFDRCGVTSPETPTPAPESLPATIPQSIRVGPDPRRLDGLLVRPTRLFRSAIVLQQNGTIRREYLDHMLFWTTVDLENKRSISRPILTTIARTCPPQSPCSVKAMIVFRTGWNRKDCRKGRELHVLTLLSLTGDNGRFSDRSEDQ